MAKNLKNNLKKISQNICRDSLTELKPSRSWEEIEKARKNNKLLTFGLELTKKCNLRCVYCYANAGEKTEDELTLKETLDAIKQAYSLGARKIGIIGGGETLLYQDLFRVIDFMKNLGISVTVFTNAILITPNIAKELFKRRVNIVAKCNSLNPKIQDFLTGVDGSFKRIQEGIRNLRKAGYPNKECSLVIETVICRQNFKELPDLWRWIRNQGCIPFFERLTIQGRALKFKKELEVSPQELYWLFKKILEIDQKEYGYTWSIQPPWVAKVCDRHFYNAFITSNGFIQPCSGVDIHLGNIRYQKLSEILKTSPVIKALRYIDKNIKGYCKDCPLHKENRCYGCRGTTYQVTGDILASDPYCWRSPKFKKRRRKVHIKKIYRLLSEYFGAQGWWHADSLFEICVGIILVQRTTWRNADRGINNLKKKHLLSVKEIVNISLKELEDLLRPAGFYRQKAKYLKTFAQYCLEKYNGNLDKWFKKPTEELREELLQLKGIGEETADSILLYAAEKPVFVVDAYTKRILTRMRAVTHVASYSKIKKLIEESLSSNIRVYKELRALFVELGKNFCKVKPQCKGCPLESVCQKYI